MSSEALLASLLAILSGLLTWLTVKYHQLMDKSKSREMEYLANNVEKQIKKHHEDILAQPLHDVVKSANNRRPVKSKSPKVTE